MSTCLTTLTPLLLTREAEIMPALAMVTVPVAPPKCRLRSSRSPLHSPRLDCPSRRLQPSCYFSEPEDSLPSPPAHSSSFGRSPSLSSRSRSDGGEGAALLAAGLELVPTTACPLPSTAGPLPAGRHRGLQGAQAESQRLEEEDSKIFCSG